MRFVVAAGLFAALAPACVAAAERVACREAEQKFETRRGNLTSLEINNFLFAAAANDCEKLVPLLLDNGASLEARDREGNRALARAAQAGRVPVITLLIARGAEIDARNIAGSTALYLASEKDRGPAIDALIAAGAAVDLPGRSGVRPLAAAAFNGAEAAVAALLAHGAQPEAGDAGGKTAADLATATEFKERLTP